MENPKCYIPIELKGYYKKYIDQPENAFKTKSIAIRTILSVYLEYRCIPSEVNEMTPEDPAGLGILECICMKLVSDPKFTREGRLLFERLADMYEEIVEKKRGLLTIMDKYFTLEQLTFYGF